MDQPESYHTIVERERAMERVLLSNLDPVSKVREITDLGVEEEDANDMVARYQIGQMQPVYYERLQFEDDPVEDEER